MQNAKNSPELFPVYINRLEGISSDTDKFDSRIRFLILDTLELAQNQWQGRTKSEGPRRIDEIHMDAKREEQIARDRNSNQRGGYGDRNRQGHGGHGHGPPRPPQMDTRVNPRTLNVSTLNAGHASITGGRPGGMRRNASHSGNDRQHEAPREQGHGRAGHSGGWTRQASGSERNNSGGAASLPPPPPARPAPDSKAEEPAAEAPAAVRARSPPAAFLDAFFACCTCELC